MTKKMHKLIFLLFAIGVYLGMFAYLYIAHPLILSDTDDWYYASYWRRPLPIFNSFNSIKVFPETFLPLCSMVAVNFVMPFMKDYVMSLAFVYAAVGAAFITAYVLLVAKVCQRISIDISPVMPCIVAVCFLMFHFLFYKNNWTANENLFWTCNVTCLFHYTITALINACLVLYFIKTESLEKRNVSDMVISGEYFRGGILVLLIYLAVFSNMFTNIVLASYAGVHMLIYTIGEIKEKRGNGAGGVLANIIRYNWLHVLILLLWIMAVIFQLFDLRNENAKAQGATGSIGGALKVYLENFTSINKMALLFFVIIIFLFLLNKFTRKHRMDIPIIEVLCSCIIVSIYLILLSGVADPHYLARCDVKIGIFFYIILAVAMMLTVLIRDNIRIGLIVLPLFAYILSSQSLNYCKSYKDFNSNGFSYIEEKRITEDVIEQFVNADEAGMDEFDLHVVKSNASDNWPYPSYAGDLIGDTLFRHDIIKRRIKANTVIDGNKNIELDISF